MNERLKEIAEEFAMHTETMTGIETDYVFDLEELERFADLVRQDERDKCAQDYLQNCCNAIAVAEHNEREACAKLCDARGDLHGGLFGSWAQDISERIRARGNHGR